MRRLLAALAAAKIEARFVGGCVRDALLGLEIGDIDLATPARAEAVIAALKKAKIKAIPTGIAHGTVTAVVNSPGPARHFEITTLRRDVETDGRHARVAFDADWTEDAARRDFTINAIYLAPDGTLFDPVGGRADLEARRVRFVGDAATRIVEDLLRILRYYRFEARFGHGEGDATARAACRDAVAKLQALSAERVQRELMRLLAAPEPLRALKLMQADGIIAAILPEATRIDRLARSPGSRAAIERPIPHPLPPRRADRGRPGRRGGAGGAAAPVERDDRNRLADLAQPWPLDPAGDAQGAAPGPVPIRQRALPRPRCCCSPPMDASAPASTKLLAIGRNLAASRSSRSAAPT